MWSARSGLDVESPVVFAGAENLQATSKMNKNTTLSNQATITASTVVPSCFLQTSVPTAPQLLLMKRSAS